jgi:hypothetical protein
MQLGFHPVAVVGKVVHTKIGKREQCTKGETINKTIKKYLIHKLENKYTKQANINMSLVINK